MPIETPVSLLVNVSSCALRNRHRESLKLLSLERGERNLQVLKPARMSKAKRDHLFLKQGMQVATSMAPLKMGRSGWMSTSQIFLTNYESHVSCSHATPTQGTDYVGVSEAAGL
jgi:hypothetical protein